MLSSIVAHGDMELEQLDVKTVFLHRNLDDEIYMHQPKRYKVMDRKRHVCHLRKSLYGLKQTPG